MKIEAGKYYRTRGGRKVGPMPKMQYVYNLTFDLDTEGHPIWSTAKVTGR